LSLATFAALRDDGVHPAPPTPPLAQGPPPAAKPDPEAPKPRAAKQIIDGRTGLHLDEGWEIVAARCTGCHSGRVVARSAGDRAHWARVLRWTQQTQELAALPPAEEDVVLEYLAKNYGPRAYARRAPLAPWLQQATP
jgi:hypothetical protein